MHQCQKWRPPLARLAGEASPAQPRAALAWLGLDNHGGGDDGDDGDQADGDDDGVSVGEACEVARGVAAPLSGLRTRTTHHHQPALVQQLYKTCPYMRHSDCWAGLCVISCPASGRAVVP